MNFQSQNDDNRLTIVQMNDALLRYETPDERPEEGDHCTVRSTEGTEYNGEVVYSVAANARCEYGCLIDGAHVHVSIS